MSRKSRNRTVQSVLTNTTVTTCDIDNETREFIMTTVIEQKC